MASAASAIYFIIFLPLASSILCQIFNKKIFAFLIALGCLCACFLLEIKILPQIFSGKIIDKNLTSSATSIALEFRLGKLSLAFLVLISLLQIISLFLYAKNFSQNLSYKFYSLYLIRFFAAVGFITSNNLFNLFIFLELFSISFCAIFLLSKDKNFLKSIFYYFVSSCAASLLIALLFLSSYYIFGQTNLEKISENFSKIPDHYRLFQFLLTAIFLISISVKFALLPLYFRNLRDFFLSNFLATDAIFLSLNLYAFASLKFSNLFLQNEILIALPCIIIFYSAFRANKILNISFSKFR